MDGQRHWRTKDDPDVGTRDRDHSTIDSVELGTSQAVLRTRHVLHMQVDLSLDARRTPQQKMRRILAELMPPVARAHR